MRLTQLRGALAIGVVGALLAVPVTADAYTTRNFTNNNDATITNGQFDRTVNVNIPTNERIVDVDAITRKRHTQANDIDVALLWPNVAGGATSAEQRSILLLSDPGVNAADWGPGDGSIFVTWEFDQQSGQVILCGFNGDYTGGVSQPSDCDPGNDGVNESFNNGFVPQQTSLNVLGTPGSQGQLRNGTWRFRVRDDNNNGQTGDWDFGRVQITTTEPIADITASNTSPTVGQCITVTDGNSAADPDLVADVPAATITQREYDLDGNGSFETGGNSDTINNVCFTSAGPRTLGIRVTQTGGATQTDTIVVNVIAPENSAQCTAGGSVFNGGGDADAFTGGGGQDRIFGNGGEDQLNGAGGNDCVNGGAGTDVIDGGTGNDILIGGGPEGDKIADTGGAGDQDLVFSGDGDDAVNVDDGDGNDFVDCGDGNDIADVDPGDRTINCEQVI